ncbi:MAG: twin-arginine translocase subunit TatC [Acidimicrobiia bacterium]
MKLPLRRRSAPSDRSGPMSLVDHLAELRSRLIKALLALAAGAVVGFFLYDPVLDRLVAPYCDVKRSIDATTTCKLVVTDPLESFSIRLKLSAYLGLLFASPVVLWQLWRFITPGLYPREKRYAVPFVASSILLFLAGAGLAIATFPKTLEFFAAFGGSELELLYTPGKYLGLLILMMVIFGLGFEFPVILTFLQVAGVLSWRRLVSWRRYAIVGIFVVDAVITPSGDPVTLLAMAVPMVLFYEMSILIGRFVLRRS